MRSRAVVVLWEKQGLLREATIDARRGKLYRASDVERFVAARVAKSLLKPRKRAPVPEATAVRGPTTADIFKAFSEGKDLRQIVMELRVPPHVVRELYAEWCTPLDAGEAARRQREAEARMAQQAKAVEQQQREIMRMLGQALGAKSKGASSEEPAEAPPSGESLP